MRVVIVDDHAGFRASLRALLEAGGIRVVGEAAQGGGALDLVRRLQPDLVLLDVLLPDIDGIDVAERIAGLDDAPVLVLTSSHPPRDFGHRLGQAPVRSFIAKADLSAAALCALADEAS